MAYRKNAQRLPNTGAREIPPVTALRLLDKAMAQSAGRSTEPAPGIEIAGVDHDRHRQFHRVQLQARLLMNKPSQRRNVSSAPVPWGCKVAFTSGDISVSIARNNAWMMVLVVGAAQLLNSIVL